MKQQTTSSIAHRIAAVAGPSRNAHLEPESLALMKGQCGPAELVYGCRVKSKGAQATGDAKVEEETWEEEQTNMDNESFKCSAETLTNYIFDQPTATFGCSKHLSSVRCRRNVKRTSDALAFL